MKNSIKKFNTFLNERVFGGTDDVIADYVYGILKNTPGKVVPIESEADFISIEIDDDILDFHDGKVYLNEEELFFSKSKYNKLKDRLKSIENRKPKPTGEYRLEPVRVNSKEEMKKIAKNYRK